jgi:hypothetical protein
MVLTKEPLKEALGHFDDLGCLLKWTMKLSEFDVTFHPHPILKSQELTDFMAEA